MPPATSHYDADSSSNQEQCNECRPQSQSAPQGSSILAFRHVQRPCELTAQSQMPNRTPRSMDGNPADDTAVERFGEFYDGRDQLHPQEARASANTVGFDLHQGVASAWQNVKTSLFEGANNISISGNPNFSNIGSVINLHKSQSRDHLHKLVSWTAFHDSSAQDADRQVHPKARESTLKQIQCWLDHPDATERVVWLYGSAGIGKTAIVLEIAHSQPEKVAATFFFHRSDASRNRANLLFTTIAWQIATSVPATENHIIRCLERPELLTKSIESQFEHFIVQPLSATNKAGSQVQTLPLIIIIDGIDECSDEKNQKRIINAIGKAVRNRRTPLRFLIASRPEVHIQDTLDQFQGTILCIDLTKFGPTEEIRKKEAELEKREAELKRWEKGKKLKEEEWQRLEGEIRQKEEEIRKEEAARKEAEAHLKIELEKIRMGNDAARQELEKERAHFQRESARWEAERAQLKNGIDEAKEAQERLGADVAPVANYNDSESEGHPDDIVIGVIASTGTGKSSFVRLLSGDKSVRVGDTIESETSDVQIVRFIDPISGRNVTIVDTPGFDDSREGVTDTDILKRITNFLLLAYDEKQKLNGLIYLQRISDNRFQGQSDRNLRMFRKLCGTAAYQNVVVLTTFWDKVTSRKGAEREEQLKTKFFKKLAEGGAQFMRHNQTIESAQEVLQRILTLIPTNVQIQKEIREEGKSLEDTAAGSVHREEVKWLIAMHKKEVDVLKAEMEKIQERNKAERQELEQQYAHLQQRLERWETERAELKKGLREVDESRERLEKDAADGRQNREKEREKEARKRESGKSRNCILC